MQRGFYLSLFVVVRASEVRLNGWLSAILHYGTDFVRVPLKFLRQLSP